MAGKGGPHGNQYGKRKGIAQAALKKALAIHSGEAEPQETTKTYQALIDIWAKQIEQAVQDGDRHSAQLIIERLDGKPAVEVDQTLHAGEGVAFSFNLGNDPAKQEKNQEQGETSTE